MNLKESREAKGITQRAFARQIGSPVPDYNKIERGRYLPTPELMGRICRALEREYAKRKSPAGVATTDEAQEKNNPTLIVAAKGGIVNGA